MKFEIERKFLVNSKFSANSNKVNILNKVFCRQGYIKISQQDTVRVRTVKIESTSENKAFITIKGLENNIKRLEFEYEIPFEDANKIIDQICIKPIIEKIRYFIDYKGKIWHVDQFLGENDGLILAEIELNAENEPFEIPPWVEKEVTGNKHYYNAYLVLYPYKMWPEKL